MNVIVTPVFEDREASTQLFKEIALIDKSFFVVAVDDGSIREPVSLSSISNAGISGVVVKLNRNVGHQRAIAAGICYASEMYPKANIIVMDSDGEDVPDTIPLLLERLKDSNIDVVVAQRTQRVETIKFKAFYKLYKLVFQLLCGRIISFGNFMAMTPVAARRLAHMQELWIHVAGCVLVSKLRLKLSPIARGPRYAGKSKMNFVGLALHGFRALMVFAEDVLVRVGVACSLLAVLAISGSLLALLLKYLDFATPGWFSIALGILMLVFLQTGALTLMTLMLTGVVRNFSNSKIDYRNFVELVID